MIKSLEYKRKNKYRQEEEIKESFFMIILQIGFKIENY